MIDNEIIYKIYNKSQSVFLNPTNLYSFDDIVGGIYLYSNNCKKKKMSAVDSKTLRAFKKKDKNSDYGPKYLFDEFLENNMWRQKCHPVDK